jgi:hypothetical protein
MNQPSALALSVQGVDQCRQFLKGLASKDGSKEIWIKFGHDSIYRATWDELGNLSGTATALATERDPHSRIDKGKPIPDLLKHLHSRSQKEDGGVFFVPTQPIGLPLAECVTATDDIGIEMDHLPMDEQKALIAEFCQVTGLEFASILTSGGASVHLHLKADRHYPVGEMNRLRRLAIIAFQSDPVTARLHQPMRLPGFFRKEKNAYQELLSISDRRYSVDELTIGFNEWFEHKEWPFTYLISDAWWTEAWHPLLASSNPSTPALKQSDTQRYLVEGNAAYLARRAVESEQQRQRIANMPAISGEKISDVLQACCDRASVGDFNGVDWQGSGGHYRGQCPFHEGKTGNSAWLSNQSGALKFHCVSCTDDDPRSSFEYWISRFGLASIDEPHLKGKNYAKAAEVFLDLSGVSMPERPKVVPEINGNGHKPVDVGGFGPLVGAGEGDPKDTSGSTRSRHEIPLPNSQYHEAIELILKGLSSEPNYLESIYVQGNDFSEKWLVRVLVNADKSVRIIDPLTVDKTHVELEKRFEFHKFDKKNASIPSTCPDRIAKSLLSEGQWLSLKPLDRISRIPLLQWNGGINDIPGYYLEEKTILDVKKDEFKFKLEPTIDDAKNALKKLKHFFREFHFKDLLGIQDKINAPSIDRSGAISALLTAVSRHMYDLAPCFITNAHTPGSGKGTLASVITMIQDGKVQSERTWNPDPIELDKVIVSELLNQPPSLVIGNIDSKFGGSIIESLLTKAQYPGRVLGLSKMVYPSTKTLLMANGNNLTISKDMVRRSIMTRLDCGVEKPQNIEYEVKDIIGYTKLHRSQLFVYALTILQAFLLSGEVDTPRSKLNGFEDWDKLVRGSLLWVGESDPVQSQIALDEDDEDAVLLSRFIEVFLSDYYAGKSVTPKQMILKAEAKDPMDRGSEDYCETLREICYNFKADSFSKESLGKFLAKNQGQVKAGYCIKKLRRTNGGQPWTVEAPIQPDDRIEV